MTDRPAIGMLSSFTAPHLSGSPKWRIPAGVGTFFEMVSLDGCPGFKGPDPQPVSMSSVESRVKQRIRSRKTGAGCRPASRKNHRNFFVLAAGGPFRPCPKPHQCINVLVH